LHLVVFGNPAPQGSKKSLGLTKAGKGIIVETSPKNAPWRADVKAACQEWLQANPSFEPFDCALKVSMVFTFLRPKSVTRKKRPFPSVYPDVSKLCRSTEDAISASGLWRDDALVVDYGRLAKVYAGEDVDALPNRAGCRIWIDQKPIAVELSGRKMLELEAS